VRPPGPLPERLPPRLLAERPRVELREAVSDSPERALSLLTARAAISSARLSDRPASFSLCLMCSYWRALLLPFLTPRGGMATPFVAFVDSATPRGSN
jgi:hypothetical protein